MILPGSPYKRGRSYVVENPYSGENAQENTMERYADALDNAVGKQDQAYRHLLRANSTVLVLLLRYNARKNFFNTKEQIYNQTLAARDKAEAQLQDATYSSEKAQADFESARLNMFYSTIFGYVASLNTAQKKVALENAEPTFPKSAESEVKRMALKAMQDPDFQRVSSNVKQTSDALAAKKRLLKLRARNEKRAYTAMESAKEQLDKAEMDLNKAKSDRDNAITEFENAVRVIQNLTRFGLTKTVIRDPVIDVDEGSGELDGSGEVDGSGEEVATSIAMKTRVSPC
ncbi:hypothetical protein Ddc_16737 [Ditylenchus destructor]|nr:hypothetical protein Ddc_16737 [Ditylenchus destructor]